MSNHIKERHPLNFPPFLRSQHLEQVLGMSAAPYSDRRNGKKPWTDEQLLQIRAYFEVMSEDTQIQELWGQFIEASNEVFNIDQYEVIFQDIKRKFYETK